MMESSLSSGSDTGIKLFTLIEDENPPCRCEFVWKWLDEHAFLLTLPPPPEPQPLCRVSQYTFSQEGIQYFYSQPIPVPFPHRDIQLPYIMPAPHRISPLKPVYD